MMRQSRTQSPQACWSAGGYQERLWRIKKKLNFLIGCPVTVCIVLHPQSLPWRQTSGQRAQGFYGAFLVSKFKLSIQIFDPSIQTCNCSVQTFDPSIQICNCSVQTFDPSIQTFNPSVQIWNGSIQTFHHSIQIWNCLFQTFDSSIQTPFSSIQKYHSSS